jgi:hypothetical protein
MRSFRNRTSGSSDEVLDKGMEQRGCAMEPNSKVNVLRKTTTATRRHFGLPPIRFRQWLMCCFLNCPFRIGAVNYLPRFYVDQFSLHLALIRSR